MWISMFRYSTNWFQSLNFMKVDVEKVFSSSTLLITWTMTIEQASWTQKDVQITNCLWRIDDTTSDWIFISKFFHGLKSLNFHAQLEKQFLNI
jgi:hypothetical protein